LGFVGEDRQSGHYVVEVIENEEVVEVTPAGVVLDDVPSVLMTGIVVVGLVVGDTSVPIVVDEGAVDVVLVSGVVVGGVVGDGALVEGVAGVELLGPLPGAELLLGEPPEPTPPEGLPAMVVGAVLRRLVVVGLPSPGLETPPALELGGPPAAEVPPGELVAGLVVGVVVALVSGALEVEVGPPNWVPPGL
jgi:hypothetical protein